MRFGHILGLAIYLGMSWTWCIGMFLPVLLLRDLGVGGFFIFAIPNVLGAAAMGFVLRGEKQSETLVKDHLPACVWFSAVTILFHAFFAAWMIRRVGGHLAGLGIAVGLALFWMLLQWRRDRNFGGGNFLGGNILAAAVALAISVAMMAWGFSRPELPLPAEPLPGLGLPRIDLLWLAPLCIFGFALCPYLDLTFHAARQRLSYGESRAAFALGFLGFFTPMILFTWAYSGWLIPGVSFSRNLFPELSLILSIHLIAQTCFTAAVHVEQLGWRLRRISAGWFTLFCAAFIAVALLGIVADHARNYHGLEIGEVIYRCFMSFYALIFPAYVWLCIVPPRRTLGHLAAVVALAAPLLWLAMIEQRMAWAAPAILIPIAAKLVRGERKQIVTDPPGGPLNN